MEYASCHENSYFFKITWGFIKCKRHYELHLKTLRSSGNANEPDFQVSLFEQNLQYAECLIGWNNAGKEFVKRGPAWLGLAYCEKSIPSMVAGCVNNTVTNGLV